MKFFQARSMRALFLKTALSAFLLGLLIEPMIRAADHVYSVNQGSYSTYRLIGNLAYLVLAILLGLCFRKANAELLSSNIAKRKKYASVIFMLLLLLLLTTFLFPDLLMYYNSFISYLADRTENIVFLMFLEWVYAEATRYSIVFALSAVFFYKPSKKL